MDKSLAVMWEKVAQSFFHASKSRRAKRKTALTVTIKDNHKN